MDKMSDDFITRFLNGKLNKDEIREFEQWIGSSAENLELFNEYRKIWLGTAAGIRTGKFDPVPAWNKVHARMQSSDATNKPSGPFRHRSLVMRIMRNAAILVLFMSAGAAGSWIIFAKQKIDQAGSYVEIMAPKGSKSQITLPDGSKAWINAGSKLSYMSDFNKSDRIVKLEGEGYFSVTSNKAYPDEKTVETTLVEGMVEIEAGSNTRSGETCSYTLRPKQNIIYHIESGLAEQKSDNTAEKEQVPVRKAELIEKEIQVINNVKPELYTSWKDENWVIEGMPLDQLAVLMGRRFNSMIEIKDDALKLYKFTGTIQNETLEQMMVILSLTTPLEYSIGKGNASWMLNKDLERNYSRILKR